MLTELHLDALGVIEHCELVLGPGLTALTGETGAGKTMVVEAIELLVGGRADASMVRPGATEARVDGRFVTGDDEFVLSRVIPVDGRSRAYVDGKVATVATLADIATRAVDLHGQHAHQALLSVAAQRAALDRYGRIDLEPLRAAREAIAAVDRQLAALGGDERARAREIDLLRYQVDELDKAAVDDPDEDAQLDRQEDLLADAQAHREASAAAVTALSDEEGARDVITRALASITGRGPFEALVARLTDVAAELDDIVAELRATGEAIEDDPQRLDQIRERRQLLHELSRKYGSDLAEVMAFHRESADRLAELERYDERAAELDARRDALQADHDRIAADIGKQRRAVAPQLAAAVEVRLRQLAMQHAAVSIEMPDDDVLGDDVRFLLAANPGSPLLPLARVASGGELARAMLAVRLALLGVDLDVEVRGGADDQPMTLVFDEVDAGIGGAAANAVGQALASLGEHHQVLVVTHLAQVAARATTQIAVEKRVDGDVTVATAQPLDGDDRVAEIARMLSGSPASTSAREHATELLAR